MVSTASQLSCLQNGFCSSSAQTCDVLGIQVCSKQLAQGAIQPPPPQHSGCVGQVATPNLPLTAVSTLYHRCLQPPCPWQPALTALLLVLSLPQSPRRCHCSASPASFGVFVSIDSACTPALISSSNNLYISWCRCTNRLPSNSWDTISTLRHMQCARHGLSACVNLPGRAGSPAMLRAKDPV